MTQEQDPSHAAIPADLRAILAELVANLAAAEATLGRLLSADRLAGIPPDLAMALTWLRADAREAMGNLTALCPPGLTARAPGREPPGVSTPAWQAELDAAMIEASRPMVETLDALRRDVAALKQELVAARLLAFPQTIQS
jgi:hypothetical protein